MESMALSRVEPGRRVSVRELERWASLAAASAVIVYGFSRRSIPTSFWLPPPLRPSLTEDWSASGHSRTVTRPTTPGQRWRAIEAFTSESPFDSRRRSPRCIASGGQLENLPHVFTHLEDVTELSDGRSHWIARGPAGLGVEWDAEIINEVENKVIGWRSLPESDVVTAGSVTFAPTREGRGTQVSVHLQYTPPAGRAGAFVADGVRPRTFAHGSRGFATAQVHRSRPARFRERATGEPAI